MSGTLKVFKNNAVLLANALQAIDINGMVDETNNLILFSGQSLDGADHIQTSRGAHYIALKAGSYTAVLNVTVIELTSYITANGPLPSLTFLADGAFVRFISPVDSDGVTLFQVELPGLAAKDLTQPTGQNILGNAIRIGEWAECYYSEELDKFILQTSVNFSAESAFSSADTTLSPMVEDVDFDQVKFQIGPSVSIVNENITLNSTGIYRINFDFSTNLIEADIQGSANRELRAQMIIYLNGNPNTIIYNNHFIADELSATQTIGGFYSLTLNFSIYFYHEFQAGDFFTIAFDNPVTEGVITIFGGDLLQNLTVEKIQDT